MACTTLLVGKNASYDGSTMIARNEDSGSGSYAPKRRELVLPKDQPKKYRSVLSHVEIPLPKNPMRYTSMRNATDEEGIWGAAGVNAVNVSMTATETITTNPRVQGADPMVRFIPASEEVKEKAGGIGEEDFVTIILPYIHSAREGAERLGSLLETYGTYEMNGIAFSDVNEIWWLETIGGHHWIAKRVPDDQYVVMPNQLGIDSFDLKDAETEKKEYMCSSDLRAFITENHLSLLPEDIFNPREVFGSHDDSDHIYNTPRAWFIERTLNPRTFGWDGEDAGYRPEDDDLPWGLVPERKLTVEDVKYVLSAHYQGTPFDPYGRESGQNGRYRAIGINRNNFLSLTQIRPYLPEEYRAVEWIAMSSNVFNAFVPQYANVDSVPEYLSNTSKEVSTENFYWTNRIIAALADAAFRTTQIHIERYQNKVASEAYRILLETEKALRKKPLSGKKLTAFLEKANQEIVDNTKKETQSTLDQVLFETTNLMKNAFSRSDA